MNAKHKQQEAGAVLAEIPEGAEAESDVARYLMANPEFFLRHPDLLEELAIPHACGRAVSLLEFQVIALREQAHQLRHRIDELIDTARINDELGQRLHRLTLQLITCGDAREAFHTLYKSLAEDFAADDAAVRWFARPASSEALGLAEFVGEDKQAEALFDNVLKSGRVFCGRLKAAQAAHLFGDAGARIGSAALVPLAEDGHRGIFAIASRDVQRFHPGMGTVFLERLGQLLQKVLAQHTAEA